MRRFVAYTAVALLIGGLFGYLAIKDVDLAAVSDFWTTADKTRLVGFSALFVAMYAVCHGARVVRWYELLHPIATVPRSLAVRVAIVGFAAIVLLPLRLGEFVRPILLARKSDVPVSAGLGTAVVERVVDGLTITGLLFLTLATYSGDASTTSMRAIGAVSAAVFVPALLMCLLAWWRRAWAARLLELTVGRVLPRLADKLEGMLFAFIDGLRALTAAHALGRFLAFSAVYWAFNGLSMWVLARFGFGIDVGPWDAMTMMTILVVGIMIPAGPAMAGNFEYFLLQGLGLFVVVEHVSGQAAIFAAFLHVLQFLVIVGPALVVMAADPESRGLLSLTRTSE